jgi:DNA invertase Pin-like site-specific DNA recombinase
MSRLEQLEGASLPRQVGAAEKYAAAHGLVLDHTVKFHDIGVSAFRGKNRTEGNLKRFLELVADGTIAPGSYLLVENLDRLSRERVRSAFNLFGDILDAGITIATIGDGHVYTKESVDKNSSELMMSIMYMSRAHEESATKSIRVAHAWGKKRNELYEQAGARRLTARAPAWLKLSSDKRTFQVFSDRAAIVRRIFEECASGIGAFTIARRLTAEGIRPFGKSRGWQSSYIKKILMSEAAIGTFQPHVMVNGKRVPSGPPVHGYFPAVVPNDLYFKAQGGLQGRRVGAAGRKGRHFRNLFSGIAKCAQCDSPMHFIDKGPKPKGGQYLQCDGARRGLGCANRKLFDYWWVEELVRATMSEEMFSKIQRRNNDQRREWQERLSAVGDERVALTRKLERWLKFDDIPELEDPGEDPLFHYIQSARSKLRALGQQENELKRKLQGIPASGESPKDLLDRIESFWAEIDLIADESERYRARASLAQELRRLLTALVFFDEETVAIGWADDEQRLCEMLAREPMRLAGDVSPVDNSE